ncbi:hypothetical protein OG756_30880 [Streptomyces sp. NBC_01310]|uniref:hypothetical protein n=1 Tax=Streptomyces sp. NBC_01310 TaxID=2903820 RepID=UPI0035B685E4|nr:hypothetical protein OG756_30880 [Streptomyces sp. NBC_01310]
MGTSISFSHGPDPAEDLEALKQRELARRIALQTARARGERPAVIRSSPARAGEGAARSPAAGTDGGAPARVTAAALLVPEGFVGQEAWDRALVFARRVLPAPASGAPGLGEMSARQLASDVLEASARLEPFEAVALLVEAADHGLPVADPVATARARALLKDDPLPLPGEPETSWQVYQDERRLQEFQLPAGRQKPLLSVLPIPVLDDFIDEEWITAAPEPDGSPRTAYLRARLVPEALSDGELSLLNWRLERERREAGPGSEPGPAWPDSWSLLLRLQQGDAQAVEEDWPVLPRTVRELLNELRTVSETGRVSRHLAEDQALWPLLERLAPEARSESKEFYGWLAVRRLLRALRHLHRAEIRGDQELAEVQRQAAWDLTGHLAFASQAVRWEAQNARAYLSAGPDPAEAARCLAHDAESHPPRQQELGDAAVSRLLGNRSFLERHRPSDRDRLVNPYLVLGVEDGSTEWKRSWRALRRELDESGCVRINQAKDAIESAQREDRDAERLVIPLAPHRWADPTAVSHRLGLPAEPVERATEPPSESDREWARAAAAREIITLATSRLPQAAGHPVAPCDPESSAL